ncbi:uncharacterized protein CLUP02_05573 [Colletotrichum lupini]|uniref:Splicing factor U2AF 23 kDa subunit n=2 Tax=Hypocreomycetidae TaxID=222543 RepID=A0A9Q8WEC0_9PEZI|nr:uncharacterized protein CLUP02_05573 [Colletotrichum lupini]UQC80091.1 hypothetical protein CLUP02_05573 [Colletotrichum lupini]
MANFLASIFGTELDKVNCSFYFKIGACRHGDRCSRKHVKPSYSQTILMPNLYQNPAYDPKNRMNPSQLQNHFDAFYEDIWCELCKYGELEELVVCDNNNDHLIGNVYARFKYEDSAQKACDDLNSRWYAARPIYCELSPVTDFREACCRLNSGEGCVRGGFCNFIHRKNPSEDLDRDLTLSTKKWLKDRGRDERSPSRSPTPEPTRPVCLKRIVVVSGGTERDGSKRQRMRTMIKLWHGSSAEQNKAGCLEIAGSRAAGHWHVVSCHERSNQQKEEEEDEECKAKPPEIENLIPIPRTCLKGSNYDPCIIIINPCLEYWE